MIKPRIVQAADAVAYLPLYIAESSSFTIKLPDGSDFSWGDAFDDAYLSPPDEHLDGIMGKNNRTGDQGCLNAIRIAWGKQIPLIGVCDPCSIVGSEDLVMVGGLINRASFWCLADEDVQRASKPEELNVSHLFIHNLGFQTGHRIGNRVLDRIAKVNANGPQPITGTFELLVDGAVWQKEQDQQSRVAAISASILSCVIAQERKFRIAFAMHDLPEYKDFLTTALVVHRDALKLAHVRQALTLLVYSLSQCEAIGNFANHAVKEILRLSNQDQRFASERRIDLAMVADDAVVSKPQVTAGPLPDITKDQGRDVWRFLKTIYSPDCEISPKAWENAIKLRESAGTGNPIPRLEDYFDRSTLEVVRRIRGSTDLRLRDGVLIGASMLFVGLFVDKVPIWMSIFGGVALGLFLGAKFVRSGSQGLKRLFDIGAVVAWWALIALLVTTIAASGIVVALEENGTWPDISASVGPALNGTWQWAAAKTENIYQWALFFLALANTLAFAIVRKSSAARLLPAWVRRSFSGSSE